MERPGFQQDLARSGEERTAGLYGFHQYENADGGKDLRAYEHLSSGSTGIWRGGSVCVRFFGFRRVCCQRRKASADRTALVAGSLPGIGRNLPDPGGNVASQRKIRISRVRSEIKR